MLNPEERRLEQFKIQDAGSYEMHAEDFYQSEIVLAKPFTEKMMEFVNIKPEQKILDVGTGPGILAFPIAKALNNRGEVIGIDLSEEMITTSLLHAKQRGISNVQFNVMDAENLEFDNSEFDSVVSMRAMRHFPDIDKALSEIFRVLKPGGNFAISIGSRMPPWGYGRLKSYWIGISRELKNRLLSDLVAPNFTTKLSAEYLHDIPAPLQISWGGREPEKTLLQHIKKTGFLIENVEWSYNIVPTKNIDEFWKYQLAVVTEVRKRYQKANADLQNKFRNRFYELSEHALSKSRNLYYCGSVFAIGGRKP